MKNRRRTAFLAVVTAMCSAACSLVIGIDGDVQESTTTTQSNDGGVVGDNVIVITPADANSPFLTSELVPPLQQGGTTLLKVKRRADPTSAGRFAAISISGLPRGVTTQPFPSTIKEGESFDITLVAAPNAALGDATVTVTADDVGDFKLPISLKVTGNLDDTFGDAGVVIVPLSLELEELDEIGLAVDPASGKIYVAARVANADDFLTAALLRFDENGQSDKTYGDGGTLGVPGTTFEDAYGRAVFVDGAGAVLMFGDGQRVSEGPSEPFAHAPPSTGVKTFATRPPGVVDSPTRTRVVARRATGDHVGLLNRFGAGNALSSSLLFRTDATGAADNAFGGASPYVPVAAFLGDDLAIAAGGKMLLFGAILSASEEESAAVVGRLATGAPDLSFGDDGGVTRAAGPYESRAHAGAVQPGGQIVVAGEIAPDGGGHRAMRIGRLTASGKTDPTFNDGGVAIVAAPGASTASARAVVPLANGNLVIAGIAANLDADDFPIDSRIVVTRITPAGTLDETFALKGFSMLSLGREVEVRRVAFQKGKLIVAALVLNNLETYDVALVRYIP